MLIAGNFLHELWFITQLVSLLKRTLPRWQSCCFVLQEAKGSAAQAELRLDQTSGQVSALHGEVQALKARLASDAAVQQVRRLSHICLVHNNSLSVGMHSFSLSHSFVLRVFATFGSSSCQAGFVQTYLIGIPLYAADQMGYNRFMT